MPTRRCRSFPVGPSAFRATAGVWALLVLSPVAAAADPGAELRLAVDGKPVAVIVVPPAGDKAARREQELTTAVLVDHVRQISGATLPVVREADLGDFRVEAGRLVPAPGKAQAAAFVLLGEG